MYLFRRYNEEEELRHCDAQIVVYYLLIYVQIQKEDRMRKRKLDDLFFILIWFKN